MALVVKNLLANAEDRKRCKFNPWVGKIPWRRHHNPLWYSCLENPTDRGAWLATIHGVTKSHTWLKQLSMHAQKQWPLLSLPLTTPQCVCPHTLVDTQKEKQKGKTSSIAIYRPLDRVCPCWHTRTSICHLSKWYQFFRAWLMSWLFHGRLSWPSRL